MGEVSGIFPSLREESNDQALSPSGPQGMREEGSPGNKSQTQGSLGL